MGQTPQRSKGKIGRERRRRRRRRSDSFLKGQFPFLLTRVT
jgi:hypothetical protein